MFDRIVDLLTKDDVSLCLLMIVGVTAVGGTIIVFLAVAR